MTFITICINTSELHSDVYVSSITYKHLAMSNQGHLKKTMCKRPAHIPYARSYN